MIPGSLRHPRITPLGSCLTSSGSLAFVLSFYGLPLVDSYVAEPRRSPWVRPTDFTTILSPIRRQLPRISGVVAECRLTRCLRLTALYFRSERSCTYGFHQTLPHGLLGPNLDVESLPVLRHSALASLVSGSLREGPGSGFVLHELTSGLLVMPGAHRVGTPSCPGAPPTEPYLCWSHTALRDNGLSTPLPAGSRPRLSQRQLELPWGYVGQPQSSPPLGHRYEASL